MLVQFKRQPARERSPDHNNARMPPFQRDADAPRHLVNEQVAILIEELRHNATRHEGDYRAEKAHSYATARRRRSRRGARFGAEQMARVAALLRRKWSAEQVSGILGKTGELAISHETILTAPPAAGAGC